MNPAHWHTIRQKVALPTANGYVFFSVTDILYFKSANKESVVFYTVNAEVVSMRICKGLRALAGMLHPYGFLLIKRDCLINSLHITALNKDRTIVLRNDIALHPAREKFKMILEYLSDNFNLK